MGVAVSGSGYLGPPGRLWSVLLELRVPGALAAQVATPGGASGNCMAVRTMPWIWDLKGLIDFLGLLLGLLGWGAGSSLLPRCSEHPPIPPPPPPRPCPPLARLPKPRLHPEVFKLQSWVHSGH